LKKILITFMALFILNIATNNRQAVYAAKPITQNPPADRALLSDLSNRFSLLESSWGRFHLGGNLTLESGTDLAQDQTPVLQFGQQLNVFLDAYIDRNLFFALKLAHQGGWGLSYQNTGSSTLPMNTPLDLSEAFLKLEYPDKMAYLGRFSFSFSPLGLISDFHSNPVEGLAFQQNYRNLHLIGVYSRVITFIQPETNRPTDSEDYFAVRLGLSANNSLFGLTVVPKGIAGEQNIGIDWTYNQPDSKFSAELGWYSFDSNQYPDYKVDWTQGLMLSYGKMLSPKTFVQVKTAYINPKFAPSYSSLAHSSGNNREWFQPNSKGIELLSQHQLREDLFWENRIFYWNPIVNYDQPNSNLRWQSSITKSFSPVNQLQVGIQHQTSIVDYTQAFAKWILQF